MARGKLGGRGKRAVGEAELRLGGVGSRALRTGHVRRGGGGSGGRRPWRGRGGRLGGGPGRSHGEAEAACGKQLQVRGTREQIQAHSCRHRADQATCGERTDERDGLGDGGRASAGAAHERGGERCRHDVRRIGAAAEVVPLR
jgi:hypothetical protein